MENDLENRLQAALDACARMQDQRDQLVGQFKDATAQCGVMAELLRDAFVYIEDDQDHCIETGKHLPDNCASLLSRIDAALAGKLPEPAMLEAKKPRITGVLGWEAGFNVSFANGMLDDPHISFKQLAFEGDGVSGQHVCELRAAGNFLIDRADWYVKGAAVINKPYVVTGKIAPSDALTHDEIAFLAWACNYPGCKNEDVAWGNEKDGISYQLWEKLEKLGLIECVGSYKWTATDKGRAALAASTKLEGGAS